MTDTKQKIFDADAFTELGRRMAKGEKLPCDDDPNFLKVYAAIMEVLKPDCVLPRTHEELQELIKPFLDRKFVEGIADNGNAP